MLLLNTIEKFTSDNEIHSPLQIVYLNMLGYNSDYYYRWNLLDNISIIVLYIVTFIISAISAYLSYTCNWSNMNDNIILKVVFAFIAFMLGPIYLIYYFFMNYLGKLC
jgi:hypothetical protein